jgi:PAB1-binding protein PBP1
LADPIARPVHAALLALALAATTTPAMGTVHHRTHSHPQRKAKPARHAAAKSTRHGPAAPGGATAVPAGGIKLYCAPGKNPLLVRKATQGAGTTVTAICR